MYSLKVFEKHSVVEPCSPRESLMKEIVVQTKWGMNVVAFSPQKSKVYDEQYDNEIECRKQSEAPMTVIKRKRQELTSVTNCILENSLKVHTNVINVRVHSI